jgi:purine-nucleoside/S-methyl-5'-thioadenosine phosphorylase / adenosine deaminase
MAFELIAPDWPAPANVSAVVTTRHGGVSTGVYRGLNLGDHVGDEPATVQTNRELLQSRLEPIIQLQWLSQVHGVDVVRAPCPAAAPEADAQWTNQPQVACAIMTADCLPVLFCDVGGSVVAAAHAGWRGLLAGVLEATVNAMPVAGAQLLAWLGPAIGPRAFEVGGEVRDAFITDSNAVEKQAIAACFQPGETGSDRFHCDIYALARLRLARSGVTAIYGGEYCTYSDEARFYSYRRDGQTGRMASLIYLNQNNLPT